jgi:hypothetical protein
MILEMEAIKFQKYFYKNGNNNKFKMKKNHSKWKT